MKTMALRCDCGWSTGTNNPPGDEGIEVLINRIRHHLATDPEHSDA